MRRPVQLILLASILLPACGLVTSTPPAAWPLQDPNLGTHHDPAGFSIAYPIGWRRLDTGEYPMVWSLQAPPGTTLLEKRMEIDVRETTEDCRQSTYGGGLADAAAERVLINNTDFLFESGEGLALGNIYEWSSYSTSKGGACITITCVLHSSSSGVYATEPPPFDRTAESAVFDQLIRSFRFN